MNAFNRVWVTLAASLIGALHWSGAHAQASLSTDMDQVDQALDLYFVGQTGNLYETVWPFTTATQITGLGNRPAVAAGSGIASYVNTIYNSPHIYYLTVDSHGNQDVEQLWGPSWSPSNVTQATGAAPAAPGSSLVGFIDSCAGSDNLFYIGANGHVELLTWQPSPGTTAVDVTAASRTTNALGTTLAGHIKGAGTAYQSQEVFYFDTNNHVHELWRWSGCSGGPAFDGWHNTDVSIANRDSAPLPAAGSGLAALYEATAGADAVFYVGTDQHVHELAFASSGIWSNIDITYNTNGPAVLAGTALAAHINPVAGSEEVYYFDSGAAVREFWSYSTSATTWNSPAASINASAGGAPVAAPGSPIITDINTLNSGDNLYYLDANFNIEELTAAWSYQDVTTKINAAPVRHSAKSSTIINFDTDTLGNAIAGGSAINNTYAPWGVTFSFIPCQYAVACVGGSPTQAGGPNVYAVADSLYGAFSAPNTVSVTGSPFMTMQNGVIRATFATPRNSVSIDVYQISECSDTGCLGGFSGFNTAYLAAYDVNGNLLAQQFTYTTLYQWMTITTPAPTAGQIAYVEFSVPYADANGASANQMGSAFDNLTFN